MPRSRFSGASEKPCSPDAISRPARNTAPPSGCSSPATMRKVVLLPHPLGPSRVKTSPWLMVRLRPSTAATEPNCRRTSRSSRTSSYTQVGIVSRRNRHLVLEKNFLALARGFHHRQADLERGHAPAAVVPQRFAEDHRVVQLLQLGAALGHAHRSPRE